MRKNQSIVWLLLIILTFVIFSVCAKRSPHFNNSVGMKMILIPEGSFLMGEQQNIPTETFDINGYLRTGNYDEKPVHEVTISNSFYISETEVTIEQYKKFRSEFRGNKEDAPYVAGISWNDAQKFCQWLSEKEGKTYRLPTEAEWEYVCRAGSSTFFSSGDTIPQIDTPNPWNIKNMHTNVSEWCLDWYDAYPNENLEDPVGPDTGLAKVIRGGGLDKNSPFYARSANRAGMPPDFPPAKWLEIRWQLIKEQEKDISKENKAKKPKDFKSRFAYEKFIRDKLNNQGNHHIGFRVVQAPYPQTKPKPQTRSFAIECVKQTTEQAQIGPDPSIPYFRKRFLLPTPPENSPDNLLKYHSMLGFHPAFLRHHHSPGLEVCENGDVLAVYYTSYSETTPDVAMIATRLRFGEDQWDMPDLFLDMPDANDHAPMLWNDEGQLYFFWGHNRLSSGFPFQYITSSDNGENWSPVIFPVFETLVGGHSAQPITSAFKDKVGTMYVASDGVGPESVLWISKNNGQTWMDTGGRSGGRHTSFVLLNDQRILGMGGKSSDINGFMPQSLSADGGKSWTISRTVFPSLGSNQRPTIIRLQSGRLFFAGDLQHRTGAQPRGYKERGCYVALSDNEGKNWIIKKLPGTQEHESAERRKDLRGTTLGYAVARQAPNGVIHLITSMNEPCLHFALNEAWILNEDHSAKVDTVYMKSTTNGIEDVREYKEYFPDKQLKAIWKAGKGEDGRYLLHGKQIFYHHDGSIKWRATYNLGNKIGEESFFTLSEKLVWSFEHSEDGKDKWIHWWQNGNIKSQSIWVNKKCEGPAKYWDQEGKLIEELKFLNGVLIEEKVNLNKQPPKYTEEDTDR
jgi:formylglycine-generating enzyme required for sulfatase activity